jgi:uncharacterized membrane protein HdeD (DUF308 family)
MQPKSRSWSLIVLRGLLAIAAGALVLFYPSQALGLLMTVFALFAVIAGALAVAAGIRGGLARHRWWALVLEGLVGIAAGIAAFSWPALTAIALLSIIGVWALAAGILQIAEAFNLRHESDAKWLLLLTGAFTVVFGLAAFVGPGIGLGSLAWLIGLYVLAFGFMQVAIAAELRALRWTRRV